MTNDTLSSQTGIGDPWVGRRRDIVDPRIREDDKEKRG